MAASCLADEPNIGEEMALNVLQKLVGQVQDRDGENTSLGVIAIELAHSEWAKYLQTMFVNEFCQRDAEARGSFSALCAMIGEVLVSLEPNLLAQWLDDAIIQLNSNNEAKAIEKALTISYLAFKEKFPRNMIYNPVPALINMLGRTAPSAHAAVWALYSLSRGFHTSITTGIFHEEETLAQLLKFISQPGFDKRATVGLIIILGDAKYSPAIKPLIAKLDDENWQV